MNLTDPARPKIQSKPAFLDGNRVLPELFLWPSALGEDLVTVSCMLPVAGEGPFVSKRFRAEIKEEKLGELMRKYREDPESTLAGLFSGDDDFIPTVSAEPSPKEWAKEQRRQREKREGEREKAPSLSEFSMI